MLKGASWYRWNYKIPGRRRGITFYLTCRRSGLWPTCPFLKKVSTCDGREPLPPPGDRSAHFRARWGDDPSWLRFGGISGKRTYVNVNFHYAKVLTLKTETEEGEREGMPRVNNPNGCPGPEKIHSQREEFSDHWALKWRKSTFTDREWGWGCENK